MTADTLLLLFCSLLFLAGVEATVQSTLARIKTDRAARTSGSPR
ncbi:hypothetical protein ACFYO9_37655 [Streptomyces sp. NPDC005863]